MPTFIPKQKSPASPTRVDPTPAHQQMPRNALRASPFLEPETSQLASKRSNVDWNAEDETGFGRPDTSSPAVPSLASRWDFTRIPVHSLPTPTIQTKLIVNKPGDEYEQEADRVAEHVMHMPAPKAPLSLKTNTGAAVQRKCSCGGSCEKCSKGSDDEQDFKGNLQRKASGSSSLGPAIAPPIVNQVLSSPGQPLDPGTRAFMEPRFGYDFSNVRVHSDESAKTSAQEVSARAYTVGHNIVLGKGNSASDLPLLAHELTHVMQQSGLDPIRSNAKIRLSAANAHAMLSTPILQRACDQKSIESAVGCSQSSETKYLPHVPGPLLIQFDTRCDSFKRGEEAKLQSVARVLAPNAYKSIRIDGFASEEGDKSFNDALSCARALKVASVLKDKGIDGSTLKVWSHGATAGNRPIHRSVQITPSGIRAKSKPPAIPVSPPVPGPIPPSDRTHDTTRAPPTPSGPDGTWPQWDPYAVDHRFLKRLRRIKDLITQGLQTGDEILEQLSDLESQIRGRLLGLAGVAVLGAIGIGVADKGIEIAALGGLLKELEALKRAVPRAPSYNDFPPGEGPGSRYEPPADQPNSSSPGTQSAPPGGTPATLQPIGTSPSVQNLRHPAEVLDFLDLHRKVSRSPSSMATLDELFGDTRSGKTGVSTRPGQFLPKRTRPAAAELKSIIELSERTDVRNIELVPSTNAARSPDKIVEIRQPDGSFRRTRWEDTTITGAPSDYRPRGAGSVRSADGGVRPASVDQIAGAVNRKITSTPGKLSQFDVPRPDVSTGGILAVHIPHPGPAVQQEIAQAMARMSTKLQNSSVTAVEFILPGRQTATLPGQPLAGRNVLRYIRQGNGFTLPGAP